MTSTQEWRGGPEGSTKTSVAHRNGVWDWVRAIIFNLRKAYNFIVFVFFYNHTPLVYFEPLGAAPTWAYRACSLDQF